MSVERGTVVTSGRLYLEREPGFTYDASVGLELAYCGSVGVRALSRLIEEATALKAELSESIG